MGIERITLLTAFQVGRVGLTQNPYLERASCLFWALPRWTIGWSLGLEDVCGLVGVRFRSLYFLCWCRLVHLLEFLLFTLGGCLSWVWGCSSCCVGLFVCWGSDAGWRRFLSLSWCRCPVVELPAAAAAVGGVAVGGFLFRPSLAVVATETQLQ